MMIRGRTPASPVRTAGRSRFESSVRFFTSYFTGKAPAARCDLNCSSSSGASNRACETAKERRTLFAGFGKIWLREELSRPAAETGRDNWRWCSGFCRGSASCRESRHGAWIDLLQ